ncbi:MAG: hypothetical protein SPF30_03805 [Arcanobacterium sp.]|nr:hypothetical protein [Arcanobacterium sp.]
MYFWLNLGINLLGAIFAGVQFGRICTMLKNDAGKDGNLPLTFSSALLAFAIPFYSPVSDKLGTSVSLFIALTAVSTFVTSRSIR